MLRNAYLSHFPSALSVNRRRRRRRRPVTLPCLPTCWIHASSLSPSLGPSSKAHAKPTTLAFHALRARFVRRQEEFLYTVRERRVAKKDRFYGAANRPFLDTGPVTDLLNATGCSPVHASGSPHRSLHSPRVSSWIANARKKSKAKRSRGAKRGERGEK